MYHRGICGNAALKISWNYQFQGEENYLFQSRNIFVEIIVMYHFCKYYLLKGWIWSTTEDYHMMPMWCLIELYKTMVFSTALIYNETTVPLSTFAYLNSISAY